jgi:hypothetical protein
MEKPFKLIFSSILRPVVGQDKDIYLAQASIDKLKAFIPEVDTEKNFDLLPVAFNACVVNRVNKNDDAIDTALAVSMYDSFINKPINVEHNRRAVIGVITTAGFSEFGSDKPLTLDEVKDRKSPFNISLGGLIWRSVSKDISEAIEESADPESKKYLSISTSWELGFSEYELIVIDSESKNLEDGKIISDPKLIEEVGASLRAMGGSGIITGSSQRVYRKPKDWALAMGVAITETPAAEVKGILVGTPEESDDKEDKEEKNEESISQQKQVTVKESSINSMKITSIKDITDESLKTRLRN